MFGVTHDGGRGSWRDGLRPEWMASGFRPNLNLACGSSANERTEKRESKRIANLKKSRLEVLCDL